MHFEADTLSIDEALEQLADDRALEAIGRARQDVDKERAKLPPAFAPYADDPTVENIYLQQDGFFQVARRRPLTLDEVMDGRSRPYSTRWPALDALRRAKMKLRDTEWRERTRALLDRLVQGGAGLVYFAQLTETVPRGPIGGERVRGARIIQAKGETKIKFADGSIGWKPRIVLPGPAPAQGRPQPSVAAVRLAARALYATAAASGLPAPNSHEAEDSLRQTTGGSRDLIRPILAEPEFAALRAPRGRHRN